MSGDLHCRTDRRRAEIRKAQLNGIDGVEVGDDGLTLTVTFLGKAPYGLTAANVRIDGGRRVTGIEATDVEVERDEDPELDDRLYVTVDRAGDTSRYRLSIVETGPSGLPGTEPYPGFDQRYHHSDFVFRPHCPTPFDCAGGTCGCAGGTCGCAGGTCGCAGDAGGPGADEAIGASAGPPAPVIDYTARDYETVRRVLLDRLALTVPDWVERNPADLGVTLVEALAATADQLSYQQDAVATEAYLDTARRRVSVRRHLRLIDYTLHDGRNARALVALDVTAPVTLRPGTYRFAAVDPRRSAAPSRVPAAGAPPRPEPEEPGAVIDDRDLPELDERAVVEVFEPVEARPLRLRPAHNTIHFWAWGEEDCALREGATSATLRDAWTRTADGARHAGPAGDGHGRETGRMLRLRPGDLLIFEQVRGARTGDPGDADPTCRHAVRLTSVTPAVDHLTDQPVIEVTWADDDALPFAMTLSTRGGPGCDPIDDVTVARGNVALVDHGRSLTFCGGEPERAGVPCPPPADTTCDPPAFGCSDPRARPLPAYAPPPRPVLGHWPVTQAVPFPDPERVAAGQAARLAGIPVCARRRLTRLWRSARDHDGLSDAEIDELTVLFGIACLERVELRRHPVRALRELLHRADRLLAAKLRRLDVLMARAEAGTVLDRRVAWEIARSWGAGYAAGLEPDDPVLHGPVAAALSADPRLALPAVRVRARERSPGERDAKTWEPRRDLLDSGPRDRHFVGELGDDGRLTLRFGDGRYAAPPPPGARLEIAYRIGSGAAGNVGAEAIGHLVLCHGHDGRNDGGDGDRDGPDLPGKPFPVVGVRNPLPATGGTEPESVERARRLAPLDIGRTPKRAVTAADYAALAAALPGVQRAAAEIRWTGSLQEAHVAIDARGTAVPPDGLLDAVTRALERYRRIGHDLVVAPARLVPLDVAVEVCAAPGHQHGQILADLHRVLGARTHAGASARSGAGPGGRGGRRLGFFHPDALTFGEPVRISRLVAVAAAIPGVVSVRVTRLRRLFADDAGELDAGLLRLGPLEIAQCDNDADRPENGRLEITLIEGGEGR